MANKDKTEVLEVDREQLEEALALVVAGCARADEVGPEARRWARDLLDGNVMRDVMAAPRFQPNPPGYLVAWAVLRALRGVS